MAEEKYVKPVRPATVHLEGGGSVALEIGQPIALASLASYVVEAIENGDPFTASIFEDSSIEEFEDWEAGRPTSPPKDFVRGLGSLVLPQANEAGELEGQASADETEVEVEVQPKPRRRKKAAKAEEPEASESEASEPETAEGAEGG